MKAKWIGCHPHNYEKGGNKPDRIVLHHIVGPLAAADAVFNSPYGNGTPQNPNPASATYGVGPSAIHQYVRETDIAYAQGYEANRYAISIEHAGPPYDRRTYVNSAQLIADICRRHKWSVDYALRKPRHRDYAQTACPGKLDVDRIKKLAKELLKGEVMIKSKAELRALFKKYHVDKIEESDYKWVGQPVEDFLKAAATTLKKRLAGCSESANSGKIKRILAIIKE